jgi:hypothetical protein
MKRFFKLFKRAWIPLRVYCLLSICFSRCPKLHAASIQLDGVIQYLIYNADGTRSQTYTNTFRLKLFNGNWVCKTTSGDYAEMLAFDGTNTYTQHYFPPPKAGASPKVNTAEITTAEIRSGSSCIDGVPPTRILWVAYCAKPFFENGDGSPIVSPWGIPSLLGADSMSYKAEWLDNKYFSKSPPLQDRPKILISAGSEEHEDVRFKRFQQEAMQSGVLVEYMVHPTETHRMVGMDGKLARIQAIAHFIFDE